MKKIFNKILAGALSATLVVGLVMGFTAVNAEDESTPVTLKNWVFSRGGVAYNNEYINGNEGQIDYVQMDGTNEFLDGWKKRDPEKQEQTATELSSGFEMGILKNGWDRGWDSSPMYVNPWQIDAKMPNVPIIAGHIYTVSFKAHATRKKYAYVTFSCEVDGYSMPPYSYEATYDGDKQVIVIEPDEKTFTYTFTNWVSAKDFTTSILLGNFSPDTGEKNPDYKGKFYDYGKKDISDIITEEEKAYSGTVFINNFSIVDKGKNPNFVDKPSVWVDETTTAEPAPETTTAKVEPVTSAPTPVTVKPVTPKKLAKVTTVKAVNNKKGRVTVTWKKVTNAKKYQIKFGTKTYTAKKAKLVIKKGLKVGKKYKVKVRALKNGAYLAGPWSDIVKVKVKK